MRMEYMYFPIVLLAFASCVDSSSNDSLSPAANSSGEYSDANEEPWLWRNLPGSLQPTSYNLTINLLYFLSTSDFNGQMFIEMNVLTRTHFIIVHMKQLTVKSYKIYSSGRLVVKTNSFPYESNDYWVFRTDQPLSGTVRLEVKYRGTMATLRGRNFNPVGLYKIPYVIPSTQRSSWLLVTDFRPSYARTVFPCFDEPRFKARFAITIQHLSRFSALSNMPQEGHKQLSSTTQQTNFKLSPMMCSYHVAFAVTDFKTKDINVRSNETRHRAWAQIGNLARMDYTLEVAPKIQKYLQQELGVPNKLEKLDHFAVPGDLLTNQRENWGLTTYKDSTILFNVKKDGDSAKLEALKVIARSLAHSYFGNLVTCKYWEDVWLNEGLATYYEVNAVTHIAHSLYYKEYFYGVTVELAMRTDSFQSNVGVRDGLVRSKPYWGGPIGPRFDTMLNDKGAAIIRMLESAIYSTNFKIGIKNYLTKYENGSAETYSFLNTVQRPPDSTPSTRQFMLGWVSQWGYPVVKVELHPGGRVNLMQKPFLQDPLAEPDNERMWIIPVLYRLKKLSDRRLFMTQVSEQFDIPGQSMNDWILINYDRIGYYRVNYDANLWDLLAKKLASNYADFSKLTRTMLLSDAVALAKAEQAGFDAFLSLTRYASAERDLTPWISIYEGFNEINQVFLPNISLQLQPWILNLTSKLMDELQVRDEGTYIKRLLRPYIISLACAAGHKGCINGTTRAFKEWIEDANTDAFPENCRSEVLYFGIANSDNIYEWLTTFARFKSATSTTEKYILLRALSSATGSYQQLRLLDYSVDPSLTDDAVRFEIIRHVASNPSSYNRAWEWLTTRRLTIDTRYGDGYTAFFVTPAIENFGTLARLQEVSFFLKTFYAEATDELQQAEAQIRKNMRWMEKHSGTITDWIRRNIRI